MRHTIYVYSLQNVCSRTRLLLHKNHWPNQPRKTCQAFQDTIETLKVLQHWVVSGCGGTKADFWNRSEKYLACDQMNWSTNLFSPTTKLFGRKRGPPITQQFLQLQCLTKNYLLNLHCMYTAMVKTTRKVYQI